MTNTVKFTIEDVEHVSKLANLPLTNEQKDKFLHQLPEVLGYMEKIQKLNTEGVVETSQTTGLENVLRDDVVDEKRVLTQPQALANAQNTHDGYFMVKSVFESEE